MAGANNYAFLRQLLEKIKHSQNALCPTDEDSNQVNPMTSLFCHSL